MTTRTIRRGATVTISRSLQPGDALRIQPAGTGIVAGDLSNAGSITAIGGRSGGGAGGTLSVTGTLANSGGITLDGGGRGFYAPPGQGAQMVASGVLVNTGTISALGGAGGTYLESGAGGGTLTVSGSLTNEATILLRGGNGATSFYAYSGGGGGVLVDSGSVTNAGTIAIGGGAAGHDGYYGGGGAELSVGGVLQNSGVVRIQGGSGNGGGGLLTLDGYVHNTGRMTDAGVIDVTGGFLAANGTLLNDGSLVIDGGGGAGAVTAETAGLLRNTGYIAEVWNRSTLTVGGGLGATSPGNAGSSGGNVQLSGGENENDGQWILLGGTSGSGGGGGGGGAQMTVTNCNFFLGGTLTVGAAAGGAAATLTLGAGAGVQTTGVLQNNGVLVFQDGAFMDNGLSPSAALVNTATILAGGGEVLGLAVQNEGLVAVGVGRMSFTNDTITAPSGSGTFSVDPGGFLSLGGSTLDAHQTIVLTGAGAAASLDLAQAGVAISSPSGGVVSFLGGGSGTLAAADTHLSVYLTAAGTLTLSEAGFISATGSAGNDTIRAMAAGQTLTGGGGIDHLFGASATGDLFLDSAAGLNGDVIGGFAGSDAIDVTNIAASGATLGWVQGASQGTLSVSGSGTSTAIVLTGTFQASDFVTGVDGHGGVLVTLHG
jgi:hypothetical protein